MRAKRASAIAFGLDSGTASLGSDAPIVELIGEVRFKKGSVEGGDWRIGVGDGAEVARAACFQAKGFQRPPS